MVADIVFPNGNEAAFLERAKQLGIEKLVFVYDKPMQDHPVLATPLSVEKMKSRAVKVVIRSTEQDLHIIEHYEPWLMLDFEQSPRQDALHQRASGLNHILARACAQHKVTVAFSLASLLAANPVRRAQIMGRMTQNIQLCRKYKVPMKIASFATSPEGIRNPADLHSLFVSLGMHPNEAKIALL